MCPPGCKLAPPITSTDPDTDPSPSAALRIADLVCTEHATRRRVLSSVHLTQLLSMLLSQMCHEHGLGHWAASLALGNSLKLLLQSGADQPPSAGLSSGNTMAQVLSLQADCYSRLAVSAESAGSSSSSIAGSGSGAGSGGKKAELLMKAHDRASSAFTAEASPHTLRLAFITGMAAALGGADTPGATVVEAAICACEAMPLMGEGDEVAASQAHLSRLQDLIAALKLLPESPSPLLTAAKTHLLQAWFTHYRQHQHIYAASGEGRPVGYLAMLGELLTVFVTAHYRSPASLPNPNPNPAAWSAFEYSPCGGIGVVLAASGSLDSHSTLLPAERNPLMPAHGLPTVLIMAPTEAEADVQAKCGAKDRTAMQMDTLAEEEEVLTHPQTPPSMGRGAVGGCSVVAAENGRGSTVAMYARDGDGQQEPTDEAMRIDPQPTPCTLCTPREMPLPVPVPMPTGEPNKNPTSNSNPAVKAGPPDQGETELHCTQQLSAGYASPGTGTDAMGQGEVGDDDEGGEGSPFAAAEYQEEEVKNRLVEKEPVDLPNPDEQVDPAPHLGGCSHQLRTVPCTTDQQGEPAPLAAENNSAKATHRKNFFDDDDDDIEDAPSSSLLGDVSKKRKQDAVVPHGNANASSSKRKRTRWTCKSDVEANCGAEEGTAMQMDTLAEAQSSISQKPRKIRQALTNFLTNEKPPALPTPTATEDAEGVLTFAMGPNAAACVFIHDPLGEKHCFMVLGLYPPSASVTNLEHNNKTSLEIKKLLSTEVTFQWNDLFPIAPEKNKFVDQVALSQLSVRLPRLADDLWARFVEYSDLMKAAGKPAVVWVAGVTVNDAFQASVRHRLRGLMSSYHVAGLTVEVWPCATFIIDAPHPSAHLMAHGETVSREFFKTTVGVVHALALKRHLSLDDLSVAVGAHMVERTLLAVSVFKELGLPSDGNGRLDVDYKHHRGNDWTTVLPHYQSLLAALGKETFLSIMKCHINVHIDTPGYTDTLILFFELLGKDGFVTFICNSVASRIGDPDFVAQLREWFELLGKRKFITFICGKVAKRLIDLDFQEFLRVNLARIRPVDRFVTLVARLATRYRVLDNFMVWFATTPEGKRWVTEMSDELVRQVPITSTSQVDESVYMNIFKLLAR